MLQFQEQLRLAQNYIIRLFSRFSIQKPPFMEARMFNPLEGEPLTVLAMPNIILAEHVFDVNDSVYYIVYTYAQYCILY